MSRPTPVVAEYVEGDDVTRIIIIDPRCADVILVELEPLAALALAADLAQLAHQALTAAIEGEPIGYVPTDVPAGSRRCTTIYRARNIR